jgi:hypothetical protein
MRTRIQAPDLLYPAEAAAMFGVEVHALAKWRKSGAMPAGEAYIRTPGGQCRYYREWITGYLNGQQALNGRKP